MPRPNYLEQIKNRIDKAEPGSVFIPSDFFDVTEAAKVNVCLNRLIKSGGLKRIMRGVFAKPRYSALLRRDIPPRSDDIAKAIARNYGWTVVPSGDTALNMLGLSTQVPAVWSYVSDGPYRAYEADGVTLHFRHTDNKNEIIEVSYRTALVIQALKALGKGNIDERAVKKLSGQFDRDEKRKMLEESRRVTAWVYACIKKICAEESNEAYC